MKQRVDVPEKFKELFLPNHSEEKRKRFTQIYKTELKRKLMRGESITDDMLGVKSFVLKGGRISGKTMNDELAAIQDFFGDSGDIWYCRSEENTIRQTRIHVVEQKRYGFQGVEFTVRDKV